MKVNLSDMLNNLTYKVTYNKLKGLALNQFKWDGLPETIREEWIEHLLYTYGRCLFFEDKNMGLMCLQCYDGQGRNVYNYPLSFRAVGFNYSEEYKADDVVEICNNKLRTPTDDMIHYYTNKIYEVERTLDTNVKQLKAPFVFVTDDKKELTFKRIFEKLENNEPCIYLDGAVLAGKDINEVITCLQTGVKPFLVELTDYRHDVQNEVLSSLGINNANTDKKERLITDEVNANNQFIDSNVELMLEARKRACELINEKFGLNVSVELRTPTEVKVEGGEDNVDVSKKSTE